VIAAFDMANGPFGLRKRLLDLVLASVALAFNGPVLILVALAIKLDSAGPILVRHTRIGYGGKPFQALKFRTTSIDAPDCAVTAIGRLLDFSSADELPQLFNVLTGDMSMVGPRPVDDLRKTMSIDIYRACKPGMTGLWLLGRDPKHIASYAGNWSLMLDFKIVLATVAVVVNERDGADRQHIDDLEAGWKIGLLTVFLIIAMLGMIPLLTAFLA
jgi:exopolysaccharide production protein ExoY